MRGHLSGIELARSQVPAVGTSRRVRSHRNEPASLGASPDLHSRSCCLHRRSACTSIRRRGERRSAARSYSVHDVAQIVGATLLTLNRRQDRQSGHDHEDRRARHGGRADRASFHRAGPPGHAASLTARTASRGAPTPCAKKPRVLRRPRARRTDQGLGLMAALTDDRPTGLCRRPGPLTKALALTGSFVTPTLILRKRRSPLRGGTSRSPSSGIAESRGVVALGESRLALPQPTDQAGDRDPDVHPRRTRRLARGDWKTTCGLSACSTSTLSPRRSHFRARPTGSPISCGTTPCVGFSNDERHVVVRRQAAPARLPDRARRSSFCPGLRDLVDDRRRQRTARRAAARAGPPAARSDPGTSTSFGLQLAVVTRLLPVEEERAFRAKWQRPLSSWSSTVAAGRPLCGEPYGMYVDGTTPSWSLQVRGAAFSHERVPDLGRERPAGDRVAVVLGLHRLQAARVADTRRRSAAARARRTTHRRSSRRPGLARRQGGRPEAARCPVAFGDDLQDRVAGSPSSSG